jgi:hypothetical protein
MRRTRFRLQIVVILHEVACGAGAGLATRLSSAFSQPPAVGIVRSDLPWLKQGRSVGFTVTARASTRRFVYQHASMLNALDQSMSLIAAGMADVRVADGSGLARCPADLYQHLFGHGIGEGARGREKRSKGAALAA